MVEPLPDVPKFLIKDLKCCRKLEDDTWEYDIAVHVETEEVKKTVNFNLVYIQGFIDQKPCDEVMILRDCTGRVKLTNCIIANKGSGKVIVSGAYCSVIGIFVRETGLPEISAAKITVIQSPDIDKHLYYKYWPCEVRDYQLFFLGIVKPLIVPEKQSE